MKKVVTFGEVLMRIKPIDSYRLLQNKFFEITFGGSEANVAVSLANFGINTDFVTALPSNHLSKQCVGELRGFGVDVSKIKYFGERMGIYFLEPGFNNRPPIVIYDRKHSAFSEIKLSSFDWKAIFKNTSWFHFSGIIPGLNQELGEVLLEVVKIAKTSGVTISCDYNFRQNLWQYGKAPHEVMRDIVQLIDIGIANEEDCQKCLGIMDGEKKEIFLKNGEKDLDYFRYLSEEVIRLFPNIKLQAITLHQNKSANHTNWSACLFDGNNFFTSATHEIKNIVDRVGTGDAFSAGLIFGLISKMNKQKTLDFATAASSLKHSISGDYNRVDISEVNKVIAGNISGRIER